MAVLAMTVLSSMATVFGMTMLSMGVVSVATVVVVVLLGMLVLIVRVGVVITVLLLMAVAIIVVALLAALLWMARHDRVVESPAADTRSVEDRDETRHEGGGWREEERKREDGEGERG